jgi:hypothetical protein
MKVGLSVASPRSALEPPGCGLSTAIPHAGLVETNVLALQFRISEIGGREPRKLKACIKRDCQKRLFRYICHPEEKKLVFFLRPALKCWTVLAKVAELVDAHDSKSCALGRVGSIPTFGTEAGNLEEFLNCPLLILRYKFGLKRSLNFITPFRRSSN